MTTLLIDNYDSFTYNLYQYLTELGAEVVVQRNDKVTLDECIARWSRTTSSSRPARATRTTPASPATSSRRLPGRCRCWASASATSAFMTCTVARWRARAKSSTARIRDHRPRRQGRLRGRARTGFTAVRYHSLAGTPETQPDPLEVTATHRKRRDHGRAPQELKVEGVQFHPESIATEHGKDILRNFLDMEGGRW